LPTLPSNGHCIWFIFLPIATMSFVFCQSCRPTATVSGLYCQNFLPLATVSCFFVAQFSSDGYCVFYCRSAFQSPLCLDFVAKIFWNSCHWPLLKWKEVYG
jgi:hypothetical protein